MHGEKGVVVGDFGKDIRYVPIGIEVSLISQLEALFANCRHSVSSTVS